MCNKLTEHYVTELIVHWHRTDCTSSQNGLYIVTNWLCIVTELTVRYAKNWLNIMSQNWLYILLIWSSPQYFHSACYLLLRNVLFIWLAEAEELRIALFISSTVLFSIQISEPFSSPNKRWISPFKTNWGVFTLNNCRNIEETFIFNIHTHGKYANLVHLTWFKLWFHSIRLEGLV